MVQSLPAFPEILYIRIVDERLSAANILLVAVATGYRKSLPVGLYTAASGKAGLEPVQEFMVEDWLADIESQRREEGVAEWMP